MRASRSLLALASLSAVAAALVGCGTQSTAGRAVVKASVVKAPAVHEVAAAGPAQPLVYQPIGATAARRATPPIGHVFVINMENESAKSTYGSSSPATYVSKTLRSKGVFLAAYDGVAHHSLPNYIAQISGQGANPTTQADCGTFSDFKQTGTAAPGQAVGQGCVYPAGTPSLPFQMDGVGLSWKGYMDDMEGDCEHPGLNKKDNTQKATPSAQYATRHDPFMYFHDVIDDSAYCQEHVVPLTDLPADLSHISTTPALSYITPDLCNDGHDAPCADGRPGGLTTVNAFMKAVVPRILASPAFRADGLLVITTDESDIHDTAAAGGASQSANTSQAGITGPGGGNIGTLLLSRFIKPGSTSTKPYNHYSLLGSIETIFGLPKIGYAATVAPFGSDVYTAAAGSSGNTAPSVRVTVDRSPQQVGQPVHLVATATDAQTPHGLTITWNLHNGGTTNDASGARITHAWSSPGHKAVTVTVTDAGGLTTVRTVYVDVTSTPPSRSATVSP